MALTLNPIDISVDAFPLEKTFLFYDEKWSYVRYFLKKYKRIKTFNKLYERRGELVCEMECDLGILRGELKHEFIELMEELAEELGIR